MQMLFFRGEHRLQHLAASVVTDLYRVRDHSVETADRHGFDLKIKRELVEDALAHPDLLKPRQIRNAVEMKDPLDNLLGMVHLADRLRADFLRQPLEAPVLAHHRMDKVLVNPGQLARKEFVEPLDKLGVTLHGSPPCSGPVQPSSPDRTITVQMINFTY